MRIVMYPWFAMGHLTPFLHMSNKLAARGHEIFFLVPTRTKEKLQQFNLHPQSIKFLPLVVPQVEGLPPGAETASDVPNSLLHLIRQAMDLTRPDVECFLQEIKPHFVFFDLQYWLPSVARPLGIKTIRFLIVTPATAACAGLNEEATASDLVNPAPGFPSSAIKLRKHEARLLYSMLNRKDSENNGLTFVRRLIIGNADSDAIGFKACEEMEGTYCKFFEKTFKKPVILAGPVLPEPPTSILEEKWTKWLNGFKDREVIYCAFGSECILQKDQFQELLLGFELTGLPFFAALKPPFGTKTVEEALPEGFEERTQGKGVVHGGWVQQQLILAHPSVGCFVTHCGSGSLSEGLVSQCQMVLLPHMADHAINARMMSGDLRAGVEVEKGDEDGLFTKEGVCKSIRMVMDEESEIGKEVRANHAKWREFLLTPGLESAYLDQFVHKLQGILLSN